MPLAVEQIVDALGCDARVLADAPALRALCDRVVRELALVVVGTPQWHVFADTALGPGGATGLYLLSESHLSIHTWPERGAAAINLCCCRPRAAFAWDAILRDVLRADRVVVRVVERGQ